VWAVTRVAITIDLNADVGEGCGQDAALMPLISSANIACGIHAGDNDSMREAVALALEHGVAIGAHPSFPDREHFGRREMQLDARELHQCIVAQIESLANVAAAAGAQLRHVKPHGALYNMAARDEAIAETVVAAIRSVDSTLMMFGLAGSVMLTVAERLGLRAISEAFADRAYRPDGSLLPRNQQGSVLHDETGVASRAVAMVQGGAIIAVDGSHVAIRADTICLHGDSPGADVMALRIRDAFAAAGVRIVAPKERR
jgi:5-oxoprolinase (ATP-hydrolysing) subunit A